MGQTRKAVEDFVAGLRSGTIVVAEHLAPQMQELLEGVEVDENGVVVFDTASPALRSAARAFYAAGRALEQETASAEPQTDIRSVDAVAYTRELFYRLHVVFLAHTGRTPAAFAPDDDFVAGVRRLDADLADPGRRRDVADESRRSLINLTDHYKKSGGVLQAAADLGGTKLVLGGKQSFTECSYHAVRSMMLYADTILIPDPVMRWFEVDPVHERFPIASMLKDIFWLLKLKPLVDADLPVPPIVLFPSYEKLLEHDDDTTKFAIEHDALTLFSYMFGAHFDDYSEVIQHARSRGEEVLAHVEKHRAFIALGGEVGMPMREAIALHRRRLARERSDALLARLREAPDAVLVCIAIHERLVPLHHLEENALTLRAAPLMSLHSHWHYAGLRRDALGTRMREDGISTKTMTLLQALEDGPTSWLGNVTVPELVRLLGEGANRQFRERMGSVIQRLSEPDAVRVERVVAEVAHEFRATMAEHEAEVRRIDSSSRSAFAAASAVTLVTAAASFLPWFPAAGVAAGMATVGAALAGQQARAHVEKQRLNRTLLGVLAASAKTAGR